jgi:hypothetical protein
VDRWSGSGLSLLGRIVQQIDIEKLVSERTTRSTMIVDAGAVTHKKVQQIIKQVRTEHPYGR